jgi:predicted DNA-binding transcriptional regulator YafY
MNRTDRLLAIVLELQAKGWQRAEDLAKTFEISKRTVYRDMLALAESGVPVVSSPGQGYSLMEGYFLPPLSFSTDEAVTLLLGADYMAQNFDAEYRTAARSTISKIEVVLSHRLRDDVSDLKRRMRFISVLSLSRQEPPELLAQIRRAIVQRRTIRFEYHARVSEEPHTVREGDPYSLVNYNRRWYVRAYDHLRQDIRSFRLVRMEQVKVLERVFTPLPDADPLGSAR